MGQEQLFFALQFIKKEYYISVISPGKTIPYPYQNRNQFFKPPNFRL